MKTIGFIDYYISEWHANNYPAWIKEANEMLGTDFVVKYAWAELDKSPVDGRTTDEWCKAFGAEKCDTIEELCEKSDYILILAPTNPETHLRYAEKAFQYRKNTYVDKSFAPDFATAKKIFDLAEKYGTKFFSTSALRYATELDEYAGKCEAVTLIDSGASINEYVIHSTEMLVKLMGIGAKSVKCENNLDQHIITIAYQDGRKANLVFMSNYGTPTAFIPLVKGGESKYVPVESSLFTGLLAGILKFYQTGETPFDGNQTLEVMKIREAIVKAEIDSEKWIEI